MRCGGERPPQRSGQRHLTGPTALADNEAPTKDVHEARPRPHNKFSKRTGKATMSKIEWTDNTWNPTTGCTKISDGCKNCYAIPQSHRLMLMGQPKYANDFNLTMHETELQKPLHWKKPRRVFVNSMSDLFHEEVTTEFIQQVFNVMNQAYWHHFQVLTKRARADASQILCVSCT
jgi:protein gp37